MDRRGVTPRNPLTTAAAILALALPAFAGDLDDARKLRDAGKWDEAVAAYEKAAAADPASADAALGLCETLCGVGKYERAAKSVNAALEAHPGHVGLMTAKARAYVLLAGKLDAEGGDPQAIMGYAGDGDRWVKQVLEKEPKSPEARVLRAKVLQFMGGGSTPEAISLLEAVAADAPGFFDAHWELGVAAMNAARADSGNKARWAKAEKHFRDAFQADGKSGRALLQATYAKQWQGQAGSNVLIGDYEQCARLLPADDAPLAQIFKLRKWAAPDARAAFARLAEKDKLPKAAALLAAMDGEAAVAAGRDKEAVAALSKAVEAWGKGPVGDLYWVVGGAAFNAQSLSADQRETLWTALWKQWPERFDAANNAGLWFRDVGRNYEKSAVWYERAAAVATHSPQVLNDTGLIYHYHLGKNDVAEGWYTKAIEAAEANEVDPWQAAKDPDSMGYRDALNNMAKLLRDAKRWKDLGSFVDDHVPDAWPGREEWKRAAESGGK